MCVRAYLKYAVQYGVTHAFVQEGFSFNAFSSDAGESTVIASAGDDTNFQFELQLRLLRVRISHLAQHCVAVKYRGQEVQMIVYSLKDAAFSLLKPKPNIERFQSGCTAKCPNIRWCFIGFIKFR